jgi:hypothetical protein
VNHDAVVTQTQGGGSSIAYSRLVAIDFMIMPLSRYVAGDYVPPAMQLAWDMGLPYTIFGPEGTKQYPQGVPFGGPEAPARREQIVDAIIAELRALPAPVPTQLWDERSQAEPCFHRVDPTSFGAVLDEAARRGRGFLGVFGRKQSHLLGLLLLPCTFDEPFEMQSPLTVQTGSCTRALQELTSTRWSEACASAVETLREALDDAVRLRLPLIIDV